MWMHTHSLSLKLTARVPARALLPSMDSPPGVIGALLIPATAFRLRVKLQTRQPVIKLYWRLSRERGVVYSRLNGASRVANQSREKI